VSDPYLLDAVSVTEIREHLREGALRMISDSDQHSRSTGLQGREKPLPMAEARRSLDVPLLFIY
jgi:hypothetical protein